TGDRRVRGCRVEQLRAVAQYVQVRDAFPTASEHGVQASEDPSGVLGGLFGDEPGEVFVGQATESGPVEEGGHGVRPGGGDLRLAGRGCGNGGETRVFSLERMSPDLV